MTAYFKSFHRQTTILIYLPYYIGFWNYAQMQNGIIWLWAHNSINGGTIPKGTQPQDHLLDVY